jgi:sugar lactone lactonase YvrE
MTDWQALPDTHSSLGESPVWSAADNCLWWVDITGRTINRLDRAGGVSRLRAPELIGAVVPRADGGLVAAMQSALFAVDATGSFEPIGAPEDHPPTHRFNDATTDPAGRLLIGTMCLDPGGAPSGVLYAFDGRDWRALRGGFRTVNGLAVSPDGQSLWVSDSHGDVRTVWVHAYDLATGALGPVRHSFRLDDALGRPDGAAFDAAGGYWVAGNDGWAVHRYRADGTLDRSLALPVQKPSKPAFGGADLDSLYVTSIALHLTDPDAQPHAGAVFACVPGVTGLPLAPFAV